MPTESKIRTKAQLMAETAFGRVRAHCETAAGDDPPRLEDGKYLVIARKFPVLVHTAGLAPALTYVQAKGRGQGYEAYRTYLDDLAAVLAAAGAVRGTGDAAALLATVRDADLRAFMLLTDRVRTAAVWLKRYAEALKTSTAERAAVDDAGGLTVDDET